MKHYKGMQKNKYETREDLKKHLIYGDYQLIADILKGQYKKSTIESQLKGNRTLKQPIIDAANKVILMRESLFS